MQFNVVSALYLDGYHRRATAQVSADEVEPHPPWFFLCIYMYILYQSRTLGRLCTLPPSSNVHHPLNECNESNFPDAMSNARKRQLSISSYTVFNTANACPTRPQPLSSHRPRCKPPHFISRPHHPSSQPPPSPASVRSSSGRPQVSLQHATSQYLPAHPARTQSQQSNRKKGKKNYSAS